VLINVRVCIVMTKSLVSSFDEYFQVVLADTAELRKEVYRLRYEVYCREFRFEREEDFPNGLETDSFDDNRSRHCLLLHRQSGLFAGCVRLVFNGQTTIESTLPFEYGLDDDLKTARVISLLQHHKEVGEISRLAVPAEFRRRKADTGSPIGDISERSFSRDEKRSFPYIPLGLYLTAAAVGLEMNMRGVFAMMEPRLVRHLQRFGIVFEQVGDLTYYHGERAPFYISKQGLFDQLQLPVRDLLDLILSEISTQMKTGKQLVC
jgi:N-acyl amino acid synthase of PEP-CTERM/exosortase system